MCEFKFLVKNLFLVKKEKKERQLLRQIECKQF